MTDVVGPIAAILLIFGVYWVAQNLDILGDSKLARLDIEKITAETRQREAEIRKAELDVEMGKLAIEARKLDQLEYKSPTDAKDARYRIIDDKSEDEESK